MNRIAQLNITVGGKTYSGAGDSLTQAAQELEREVDVAEARHYLVGNIEAHLLQIRLVEEQLARLRRMHPRARGVASGIASDERTLASHRASLEARRVELAALDAAGEERIALTPKGWAAVVAMAKGEGR